MRLSTIALALVLLMTAWNTAEAQIDVSPDSLRFPCTLLHHSSARIIRIHNAGSETIEEIEYKISETGSSAFICGKKFKDKIPPGGSRIDTIWFTPTSVGPSLGRLEVTAKDQTDRERSDVVWMLGQGVDPNRLRVAVSGPPQPPGKDELRFSPTKIGDTSTITLTITNPSCVPAVIIVKSLVGDDPDQFRILSGAQRPDTVDNTTSTRLVIGFIPTRPGRQRTTLIISTADSLRMSIDMEGDDAPNSDPELNFGPVPVGARLVGFPMWKGGQTTISQTRITGDNATEFDYLGPTPPFDVGGIGRSDTLPIAFAPTSTGEKEGLFEAVYGGFGNTARLRLRGEGVPNPFDISPELLNMGVVQAGLSRTMIDTIRLRNISSTPFRIDSVRLGGRNPENFAVTGTDAGQLHGQGVVPYSATFSPDAEKQYAAVALFYISFGRDGNINMTLTVQLTGNGSKGRPHVQPLASEYDFGNIPVDSESDTMRIGIVNVGNEPDTVTQFSLDNLNEFTIASAQQLPFALRPHADTLWLACTFAPKSLGIKSAGINIVPRASTGFTITLRGASRSSSVWATPKSIDMGEVAIDHSRTASDTLVLHNGGSTPVKLTGTTMTGPDAGAFSVSPIPSSPLGVGDRTALDVTFTPSKAGPFKATVEIMTEDAGVVTVDLSGTGIPHAELAWLDASYDLGKVTVGDTVSHRVGIVNIGTADETVRKIETASPADGDFSLTVPSLPATLRAGGFDTVWVDIMFIPSGAGPHNLRIEAEGTTSEAETSISGTGVSALPDPGSASPIAWLDSAEVAVNTPFALTLHLSKPLDATDGVTSYRAELRYPMSSLYLNDITGIGNNAAQQRFGDIVVVTGTSSTPLTGDELFTMTMQGLVTGKARNIVEVLDLTLGTDNHIPANDGEVLLHGCDIDYGVAYGKPTAITAITPVPIDRDATIRYYAPSGRTPTLRLVDVTGRAVLNEELSQGTGSEQEASVSFANVQNGFYVLELRLGSQISTRPILISR